MKDPESARQRAKALRLDEERRRKAEVFAEGESDQVEEPSQASKPEKRRSSHPIRNKVLLVGAGALFVGGAVFYKDRKDHANKVAAHKTQVENIQTAENRSIGTKQAIGAQCLNKSVLLRAGVVVEKTDISYKAELGQPGSEAFTIQPGKELVVNQPIIDKPSDGGGTRYLFTLNPDTYEATGPHMVDKTYKARVSSNRQHLSDEEMGAQSFYVDFDRFKDKVVDGKHLVVRYPLPWLEGIEKTDCNIDGLGNVFTGNGSAAYAVDSKAGLDESLRKANGLERDK
jgi:hypothetical protein